jgi:hypothetical protein
VRLRLGIGGKVGPLRGGISTRGFGVGVGPLSIGGSTRRRRSSSGRGKGGGGSDFAAGCLMGVILLVALGIGVTNWVRSVVQHVSNHARPAAAVVAAQRPVVTRYVAQVYTLPTTCWMVVGTRVGNTADIDQPYRQAYCGDGTISLSGVGVENVTVAVHSHTVEAIELGVLTQAGTRWTEQQIVSDESAPRLVTMTTSAADETDQEPVGDLMVATTWGSVTLGVEQALHPDPQSYRTVGSYTPWCTDALNAHAKVWPITNPAWKAAFMAGCG